MGTFWPRSNSFEFDDAGERAPGAKIYFFDAGTSTPRAVYQDAALTTPHTHPAVADGNGRWPQIFLSYGSYHEVATTSGGTELWETDNIPNPAPTDPGAGVAADSIFQTGDMILLGKNGTRSGFVRCNGKTIGSAASGATERANADAAALFAFVWDNYANGQAAVSTGRGASAAADFAANKTIAMPDYRGAAPRGFDDMGNSAAGLYGTAPIITGNGVLSGSLMGANTHALTIPQLAEHVHLVGLTSGGGSAHSHGLGTLATVAAGAHTPAGTITDSRSWTFVYGGTTSNATTGALLVITDPGGTGFTENITVTGTITFSGSAVLDHTHALSGALANESTHTHGVAGDTGPNGNGIAHNIMSRSAPVTVLMKL